MLSNQDKFSVEVIHEPVPTFPVVKSISENSSDNSASYLVEIDVFIHRGAKDEEIRDALGQFPHELYSVRDFCLVYLGWVDSEQIFALRERPFVYQIIEYVPSDPRQLNCKDSTDNVLRAEFFLPDLRSFNERQVHQCGHRVEVDGDKSLLVYRKEGQSVEDFITFVRRLPGLTSFGEVTPESIPQNGLQ
jgi:hypothetical protein